MAHDKPSHRESGMRSTSRRSPPTDRQTTAERASPTYSAEERETVQRGLRIIARMITRAHLRRQALRADTEPETPKDGEAGV